MIFNSTRVIGWLSVFLLGIIIVLPYLSRPRFDASMGSASGFFRLPLGRMDFHYWLAPLVALGSFVHAWIPMASHHMPHTNSKGLWLATVAMGLILVQLGLGVVLRFTRRGTPNLLRRAHFTLMLGITALVLLHLWMNSSMIHGRG
jgi:preprotein translocase subunit SecG